MTQITANLMDKTLQLTVSVLALDGLTRNTLAITLSWNFFPSDHQVAEPSGGPKLQTTKENIDTNIKQDDTSLLFLSKG